MKTGPGNALFFFVAEIRVICAVLTAGIVASNLLTLLSVKRFPFKRNRVRYLFLL